MATALPILSRRLGGRALRPSLAAAQHQPATARLVHSTTTKMHKEGLISSHVQPKREDFFWASIYRRAKWYHLVIMHGPAFVLGYLSMRDEPDGKKEPTSDH